MSEGPLTADASSRLVDAAIEVMGERGASGATTRLIAERAGVNEVTLFRRFATKRDLLAAALARVIAPFADAATTPTGRLETDLARVAASYAAFVDSYPDLVMRVLPEVPHDPDLAAVVVPVQHDIVQALGDIIVRHQQEGTLVTESPADIIRAFMGPLLARAALRHVLEVSQPLDPEEFVQGFLHGRSAEPRPSPHPHAP